MNIIYIVSAIFLLQFSTVTAWWCESHMLIAQIAKDNLNPAILATVNSQIALFSKTDDFPMANDIVDIACWADDLKSQDNLFAMEKWHFINLPYNPQNMTLDAMEKQNVVYEIDELSETLKKLHEHRVENNYVTVFALANLIHFYGDIHQPLHDTELYNDEFPTGDRGGLLFDIFIDDVPMKLHFAWDSVCRKYLNAPDRPLNATSRKMIETMAYHLQQTYNFSSSQKTEYNMTKVSMESYDYAVQYAYVNDTIRVNQTLDDGYISNCITVSEERLVLAGYRLASQLNYLMKGE